MPCDDPGILNLCYKGVNLAFLPGHCLFGGDHYYLVLCGSKHGGGLPGSVLTKETWIICNILLRLPTGSANTWGSNGVGPLALLRTATWLLLSM